jgi:hypothetical protein
MGFEGPPHHKLAATTAPFLHLPHEFAGAIGPERAGGWPYIRSLFRGRRGPSVPPLPQKTPPEWVAFQKEVAEPTRLEPATSGVTGRRSNQLNYDPALNLQLWQLVGGGGFEPTTPCV